MGVISYWQDCVRLADGVGVPAQAACLPQDEVTAAVVIAAILARHYAVGQWPGWYRARVEGPAVVTVTEDDERVRLARLLLEAHGRADYAACTLMAVRGRVLACTLGEPVGPAVALGD